MFEILDHFLQLRRFQKELNQRGVVKLAVYSSFFSAVKGSAYIVFLLGALGVEEVFGDVLVEHTHRIVDLNVEVCDDRVDHVFSLRDCFACTSIADDRLFDEDNALTVFVF